MTQQNDKSLEKKCVHDFEPNIDLTEIRCTKCGQDAHRTPLGIARKILNKWQNHRHVGGSEILSDLISAALQEKQDRINELLSDIDRLEHFAEKRAIGDEEIKRLCLKACGLEGHPAHRWEVLKGYEWRLMEFWQNGFREAERVYGIKKEEK